MINFWLRCALWAEIFPCRFIISNFSIRKCSAWGFAFDSIILLGFCTQEQTIRIFRSLYSCCVHQLYFVVSIYGMSLIIFERNHPFTGIYRCNMQILRCRGPSNTNFLMLKFWPFGRIIVLTKWFRVHWTGKCFV